MIEKTPIETVIARLQNALKGQGMYLQDTTTISDEEKAEQLEVILNVKRFLDNYETNSRLVNAQLQQGPADRFETYLDIEEKRARTNSAKDTVEDRILAVNIVEDTRAIIDDYVGNKVNLLKFDLDKDEEER
jgi:hypothetical protein